MPRPKTRHDAIPRQTPDEDIVFVGVKLPESLTGALDELAVRRSANRSVLIREAINRLLADEASGGEVAATG